MSNRIKSVHVEGDMVIIKREHGSTKMPYKKYQMLLRTGQLK